MSCSRWVIKPKKIYWYKYIQSTVWEHPYALKKYAVFLKFKFNRVPWFSLLGQAALCALRLWSAGPSERGP